MWYNIEENNNSNGKVIYIPVCHLPFENIFYNIEENNDSNLKVIYIQVCNLYFDDLYI